MINKDLRDYLAETIPEAVLFDSPSFDNSIIGIDSVTNGVCYSLSKMIIEMTKDDDLSEEDALEFIEYNTIRAVPYISEGIKPIIVDDTVADMFEEIGETTNDL